MLPPDPPTVRLWDTENGDEIATIPLTILPQAGDVLVLTRIKPGIRPKPRVRVPGLWQVETAPERMVSGLLGARVFKFAVRQLAPLPVMTLDEETAFLSAWEASPPLGREGTWKARQTAARAYVGRLLTPAPTPAKSRKRKAQAAA